MNHLTKLPQSVITIKHFDLSNLVQTTRLEIIYRADFALDLQKFRNPNKSFSEKSVYYTQRLLGQIQTFYEQYLKVCVVDNFARHIRQI